MRVNLTERFAKSATPEGRKSPIFYDDEVCDVDKLLAEVAKGRARPHKATTKQKRTRPLRGARPTPLRANRLGCTIRKMFNLAIRWEIRTDNPAAGFIRNPETPRERFLDLKEIERLSKVLD